MNRPSAMTSVAPNIPQLRHTGTQARASPLVYRREARCHANPTANVSVPAFGGTLVSLL